MCSIFEGSWLPIDWVNAVLVAFVMAIVVGVPLAILTSILVNRMSAFDQVRMNAIRALGSTYRFLLTPDIHELAKVKAEVSFELASCMIGATALRQGRLAAYLSYVRNRVNAFDADAMRKQAAGMGATNETSMAEKLLEIIGFETGIYAEMIFNLRPEIDALIAIGSVHADETVRHVFPVSLEQVEAEIRARKNRERDRS